VTGVSMTITITFSGSGEGAASVTEFSGIPGDDLLAEDDRVRIDRRVADSSEAGPTLTLPHT
jgi:hypothetical protein